jgi:hypothetical protein
MLRKLQMRHKLQATVFEVLPASVSARVHQLGEQQLTFTACTCAASSLRCSQTLYQMEKV